MLCPVNKKYKGGETAKITNFLFIFGFGHVKRIREMCLSAPLTRMINVTEHRGGEK